MWPLDACVKVSVFTLRLMMQRGQASLVTSQRCAGCITVPADWIQFQARMMQPLYSIVLGFWPLKCAKVKVNRIGGSRSNLNISQLIIFWFITMLALPSLTLPSLLALF
jgi:hypothetical protein